MFKVKNVIERAIKVQEDVYVCFVDYTQAFYKVKHEAIIRNLRQLKFDCNDVRSLVNLYWDLAAAMKIKDQLSE